MPRWLRLLLVALGAYLLVAYLVLPAFWEHHEHNPALRALPRVATNADDLPCDPINVALIGPEASVRAAFAAAGWRAPAPIDVRSGIGIAGSVVLDRPDPTAPVSNLFLFGRRQDLAFEQEVGRSARHRHHIRFWRAPETVDGQPLWLGAATYDRGVGFSHRTGEITHHIGADIDGERDRVVADLAGAGWVAERYQVTGIGPTMNGRNGGGDWYFTDGEMDVAVLRSAPLAAPAPTPLPNPVPIAARNQLFAWLRPLLRTWEAPAPTGDATPPR